MVGADASARRPDGDRLRRRSHLDPGQAGEHPARRRRDLGGHRADHAHATSPSPPPRPRSKDVYLERRRARRTPRGSAPPSAGGARNGRALGHHDRGRDAGRSRSGSGTTTTEPSLAPLGSGQTLLSQWLDTTGDTYWSQYTTTPGPSRRPADHDQRHGADQRPVEPGRRRGQGRAGVDRAAGGDRSPTRPRARRSPGRSTSRRPPPPRDRPRWRRSSSWWTTCRSARP